MTVQYLRLAALKPANVTEAQLYEVPANADVVGIVRIVNQSALIQSYRVAHSPSGESPAAVASFLAYDKTIDGNDIHELSVNARNLEQIRVKANSGESCSFHLSGMRRS